MRATERQQRLADELMKVDEPGQTIKKALMDAGYSEYSSNQGWAAVPNKVVKLLAKKGMRLKELGDIDTQTQEKIVRGRLVYNTIKGSDKGAMSAKLLGSEKRVNMFTADFQAGLIVLQAPTIAVDKKAELLGEVSSSNPDENSK